MDERVKAYSVSLVIIILTTLVIRVVLPNGINTSMSDKCDSLLFALSIVTPLIIFWIGYFVIKFIKII